MLYPDRVKPLVLPQLSGRKYLSLLYQKGRVVGISVDNVNKELSCHVLTKLCYLAKHLISPNGTEYYLIKDELHRVSNTGMCRMIATNVSDFVLVQDEPVIARYDRRIYYSSPPEKVSQSEFYRGENFACHLLRIDNSHLIVTHFDVVPDNNGTHVPPDPISVVLLNEATYPYTVLCSGDVVSLTPPPIVKAVSLGCPVTKSLIKISFNGLDLTIGLSIHGALYLVGQPVEDSFVSQLIKLNQRGPFGTCHKTPDGLLLITQNQLLHVNFYQDWEVITTDGQFWPLPR